MKGFSHALFALLYLKILAACDDPCSTNSMLIITGARRERRGEHRPKESDLCTLCVLLRNSGSWLRLRLRRAKSKAWFTPRDSRGRPRRRRRLASEPHHRPPFSGVQSQILSRRAHADRPATYKTAARSRE